MIENILKYFPNNIAVQIRSNVNDYNVLEEIRIRLSKPIILKLRDCEKVLSYSVNSEEILNIMQNICENSIYSYQNEICNGYITLYGGHRIGITGNVVIQDNKVINIKYISSLNFRISKQIIGASKNLIKEVLNLTNNTIYNTLIISEPGAGKTTILRDVIRTISNGKKDIFYGLTVGVVDERGELAAMYKGNLQNDLGIRTDVLSNIPKAIGMKMLIRSMAPQIIVADEIGSKEDVQAIKYAACCGIKGIFTAHGNTYSDIIQNPELKELLKENIFEKIIFLDSKEKGKIKEIYNINQILNMKAI